MTTWGMNLGYYLRGTFPRVHTMPSQPLASSSKADSWSIMRPQQESSNLSTLKWIQ